ncbi:peptidoglycan DD-metalloendopeptidase family protein [Aliihoeflea sp. PC F10.4]
MAVIGGVAAGCSSNVQRFQDSLFTNSTQQTAAVAPVAQQYPGNVDQTYTGSVAQTGSRGAPVPQAAVNGGQPVYAQQQPVYQQQGGYQQQPQQQPMYSGQANSQVARSTLAPPSGQASAPQVNQPAPMQPASNGLPAPSQPQQPAQVAAVSTAPNVGQPNTLQAPQTAAASGNGSSYTVVSGDTLSAISRRTGVSADAIRRANNLDSGLIRIGQTLTIPAGGSQPATTQVASAAPQPQRTDPVQTAATPAPQQPSAPERTQEAAYAPSAAAPSIESAARDTAAAAPDATGVGKMRWPVRGRVINNFGSGASGDGIDISVPQGTPVMAAENGVVIYAGDGLKEFGNTVLVRHDDGLVTVYGHASDLKVARGEKVTRGQQIATSGMSGNADAPKLRFEVRKDSSPVNPAGYLE